jgi:hypothetical protein
MDISAAGRKMTPKKSQAGFAIPTTNGNGRWIISIFVYSVTCFPGALDSY